MGAAVTTDRGACHLGRVIAIVSRKLRATELIETPGMGSCFGIASELLAVAGRTLPHKARGSEELW